LHTDRHVHDSGWTAVLGRLGSEWRQWRTYLHYQIQNGSTGFIPANVFCIVMSAINLRAWRKSGVS
jgi:hypothetical protein